MNKQLILNKIKKANSLNTDTELANFLGISKYTLSNWRGRNTLDWELVLSKCAILDLNWLINDEIEEVILLDVENNNFNKKCDKQNVDSDKLSDELLHEESNTSQESSLDIVLEKYKNLAIDYGALKNENENLKTKSK